MLTSNIFMVAFYSYPKFLVFSSFSLICSNTLKKGQYVQFQESPVLSIYEENGSLRIVIPTILISHSMRKSLCLSI